jgi:RNA polymerase sigma factor (sigma-70 family)
MSMDDHQLLRAYAADRSEEAFRELVRRHAAIVHGVARRQPGISAHLADDVTQSVFITLARKADTLRDEQTLVGWLYLAARFEAARAARSEARRRNREEKANDMNPAQSDDSAADVSWEQLRPVLDDAMAQLDDEDRSAVLLRFFSGQTFAEVGRIFQISEDAARKRVDRAVDKLRRNLGLRGIVSTSSALGLALGAHAAPVISEETLTAIAGGACQQASTSSAVSLGLYMSSTKITAVVATAVILLAGTLVWRDSALVSRAQENKTAAESELAVLAQRHARNQAELAALQREKAEAEARQRAIAPAVAEAARPYLLDPTYRELSRAASQARRHLQFQRFYRQLGLSPEQIERFEAAMVRQDQALLDAQVARDAGRDEQEVFRRSGPEWSSAMREILGNDGFSQLQVYLRAMSVRGFVDSIAAKSYESGQPITLAQADGLIALALANDSRYQEGRGTDPAHVNWNAVWEPAEKVLSPEQLLTFEAAVEVWGLQKRVALGRKSTGTSAP